MKDHRLQGTVAQTLHAIKRFPGCCIDRILRNTYPCLSDRGGIESSDYDMLVVVDRRTPALRIVILEVESQLMERYAGVLCGLSRGECGAPLTGRNLFALCPGAWGFQPGFSQTPACLVALPEGEGNGTIVAWQRDSDKSMVGAYGCAGELCEPAACDSLPQVETDQDALLA